MGARPPDAAVAAVNGPVLLVDDSSTDSSTAAHDPSTEEANTDASTGASMDDASTASTGGSTDAST